MQKMLIRVLSLVMLGALITSCGNDRKAQIDLACQKVQDAWDIYSGGFRKELSQMNVSLLDADANELGKIADKYIPEASQYLNEAGQIFRDLSAQDSGFAKYATAAFTTANLTGFWWVQSEGFEKEIDPLYFFCGRN